jgi:uncharacterized lipoprotein YajG
MKAKLVLLSVVILCSCAAPSTTLQNASGHTVRCDASGFGAVGIANAFIDHGDCVKRMRAAGYHNIEKGNVASTPIKKADSKLVFEIPSGWLSEELTQKMVQNGGVSYAKNKNIDAAVLISEASKYGITDFVAYTKSECAAQASNLKESSWSEIVETTINGHRAWRFWVKGIPVSGSMRMQYLGTIIEGSNTVVYVNTWTSEASFDEHHDLLESLAENVSGF